MQKDDDPFAFSDDSEHTVIKPNPGGRSPSQSQSPEHTVIAPRPAYEPAQEVKLGSRAGLNPLENAATTLFTLLGQIRNTSSHPNPGGLHQQLVSEIRQFEGRAQKAGATAESVFAARYALCTTIDEFVLSTPWGAGSVFSQKSLLSTFHKERSGGEKFFQLLNKLSQDPSRNIDLLELLYVCLSLGFQGRYAIMDNGLNELERVREGLYRTIRNARGENDSALSLNWEGVKKHADAGAGGFPAWAIMAVIALVLSLIFVGMSYRLSALSDPVNAHLSTIARDDSLLPSRLLAPPPLRRIEAPEPDRMRLKEFLAAEISQGLLVVEEMDNRSKILIAGDNLFDSGSERISPAYIPILQRIAAGLETLSGRVKVVGHSDDVPISTPRFPSNWTLSTARAESVVAILSTQMSKPGRLVPEGQADSQPLDRSKTREARARNRRVEITVLERTRRS
jgi:type VI secretion system protein ImpK